MSQILPRLVIQSCRHHHHHPSLSALCGHRHSILNPILSFNYLPKNNWASVTLTRNYASLNINKIVDEVKSYPMNRKPGRPPVVTAHKVIVKAYDIMTYPIYTLLQKPGEKLAQKNSEKATRRDKITDISQSVYPISPKRKELEENKLTTLDKLFRYTLTKYKDNPCLGTRPILSEEEVEHVKYGKILEKTLGDFEWKSYGEVDTISTHLSQGILHEVAVVKGKNRRASIGILTSEPRPEWLLTTIAAFKTNFTLVTICPKMSDDDVLKAITDTRLGGLFTTDDLVPRCRDIFEKTPLIQALFYIANPNSEKKNVSGIKLPKSIKLIEWSTLLKTGEEKVAESESVSKHTKPGPEHTALHMYNTSSPDGQVKMVKLSHQNAVSAVGGMADALHFVNKADDNHQSYLALLSPTNLLELPMEAHMFLQGGKIGYGSLSTAIKASPGLKMGTRADASLLKPTVMAVVPNILDRMCQSMVHFELKDSSEARVDLIDFFYDYKLSWTRRGYETPIVDKVLLQKYRKMIGGNVRLIFCGDSTEKLDPQTEELVDAFFNTPILFRYGGLTKSRRILSS